MSAEAEVKIATLRKLLEDPFAGYDLTPKQAEAARLIALGFSWEEIQNKLGITKSALGDRLKEAGKKLKIGSPKVYTKALFVLILAIVGEGE